ncbi:MAG: translocation/assembly module TamB domain-containing protein [Deltaproteobacteria bacterium]|nr:translocation/assembly module TamB domain-containing protein [Deltaproteobacteria bacterium]
MKLLCIFALCAIFGGVYLTKKSVLEDKFRNLLFSYIQDNYKLNVSFKSLTFSFIGPSISVQKAHLESYDLKLNAQSLEARLNFFDLLRGKITINKLFLTSGVIESQNLHIPYEEMTLRGTFRETTQELLIDGFDLRYGKEWISISGNLGFFENSNIHLNVQGYMFTQTYQKILPKISFIHGNVHYKALVTRKKLNPKIEADLEFEDLILDKQRLDKTTATLIFDNPHVYISKLNSKTQAMGRLNAHFDILLTKQKPKIQGRAHLEDFPLEEVYLFENSHLYGKANGGIQFSYNQKNDSIIILDGEVAFSKFQSPFKKLLSTQEFLMRSQVWIEPRHISFRNSIFTKDDKKYEVDHFSIVTDDNVIHLTSQSKLFDFFQTQITYSTPFSVENPSLSFQGFATNARVLQKKFNKISFKGELLEGLFRFEEVNALEDSAQYKAKGFISQKDEIIVQELQIKTPELKAQLSANLTLSGMLPYLLKGDVFVHQITYQKYLDWRSQLLKLKPLKKVISSQSQKKETLQFDLNVTTAKKFVFENNLLEFNGQAGIHVLGSDVQPLWSGNVDISKGIVFLKDHQFSIQSAQLSFPQNSPHNPNFNFNLAGHVHEYGITISGSGFLDQPQLSFVSDPPLSETDIASLLALGVTTAELKGNEALETTSMEAAAYLFSSFQERFASQARQSLGVNFRISSSFSDTKNAIRPRIFLSKNISKNVEINFSSTLDKETILEDKTVNLEWKLGNNISFLGMWEDEGQEKQDDHSGFGLDMRYRYEFE